MALRGVSPECEAENVRFHWRRVTKVGTEVKHGLGRKRPHADGKTGAKAMDQVRVEGSVLIVFDRVGLVKLDQFAGRCGGFALNLLVRRFFCVIRKTGCIVR